MGFGPLALAARLLQLQVNPALSRRAIELRQLRLFRRFLARVCRASPYYASLVRERGIDVRAARPEDFPVLTKATLMEHFDEIVTAPGIRRERVERFLESSKDPRELLDGRYVVIHTSGTSGTPAYCVYRREEWVRGWVALSRATGLSVPKRIAYLAAVRGHFAGVSLAVSHTFLPASLFGLRLLFSTKVFDINDPWEQTLDGLNAYAPDVLGSYGSTLKELAVAQRAGRLRLRPRRLICGGDSIGSADRESLSATFGAPLYNLYSATETMAIGLAGPWGPLVLFEDDMIVEIAADHILITSLLNETTPLIRYRLADTLLPADDEPQAGAAFPGFRRVAGVVGREEEKLVLRGESGAEDFIHPIVVAEFFVRGVEGFRIVRTSPESFVFEAKPAPGAAAADLEREIREQWGALLAQKRMRNVAVEVRLVASLAVDPRTGKFRLVSRVG